VVLVLLVLPFLVPRHYNIITFPTSIA
jgi:hypothetical protein